MQASKINPSPQSKHCSQPKGEARPKPASFEIPAEHVPDEVILGLRSTADTLSHHGIESLPGEIIERFSMGPGLQSESQEVLRLKLQEGKDLKSALRHLQSLPGVAYAEANQIIRLPEEPTEGPKHCPASTLKSTPNDLRPELWGLRNEAHPGADISALEAWKITTGSHQGPLIAVIDSGADYTHPDLAANIARNPGEIPGDGIDNDNNGVIDDVFGYNAYDNTGDPLDRRGHGSHVTGTIAAVGDNGLGVVGVNWKANILPIKIFNDEGVTTTDAILRGLAYARQRGALVTSNSWGGAHFSQAIFDAFASTPGLHIAAAGNSGGDISRLPAFPANFPLDSIVTVGATNRDDEPAVFSNFGRTTVELFAPGQDIYSTLPGGAFGLKSGTSMAAPHVTGVAALVGTAFPNLSPQEIKDRLIFSTDPLHSVTHKSISGGRLNAARALSVDEVPPGAPNDFGFTQIHSRGARLSWTGTGDDGWKNGPATAFEVRFSEQPIDDENWDQAAPLPTPRGEEIGQYHHALYERTPQKTETTLFAAFKAVDEVGLRSEIRTAQAVLPSTPVVVEDNFDALQSDWEGEGRWTLVDYPDRGKVWSCQPSGETSGTFSRLTSPEFDLTKSKESFLRFESRQDFDWDNLVYVDISEDGGERWSRLDRLEDRGQWSKREYDISAYDGKKIKIRVSSETLATRPGEGTMVDNFEILGRKVPD